MVLKDYTTMRLGGPAKIMTTANSPKELAAYAQRAKKEGLPILVLGEGSNIIVGDKGFDGYVILNRIRGFEVISDDNNCCKIKAGAGEKWDSVVERAVAMGLSGIETLSAIPGCVGAAPVQNIGAYGQEIADTLVELEAYDTEEDKFVILSNEQCGFYYRHSIFNSSAKGRYIVTSITLQLNHRTLSPPFYRSLQEYLDTHTITDYSPPSLRDAVIAIRAVRLPDPKKMANCGSFFKNPIIENWQADDLKKEYANPPLFDMGNKTFKVSAGWLIEEVGLKGYHQDSFYTYDKNAQVLVNEDASSYQQLDNIREHIITAVEDTFRIRLKQEPDEVGV